MIPKVIHKPFCAWLQSIIDHHLKTTAMSSKTITMKVDLSCCDECIQRMKRLLRRLKEVESSSIDAKNGVVIVSGRFDQPDKIIDKIRKKGKPVTLFSIQPDYDDDDPPALTTPSPNPNNSDKDSDESSGSSSGQGLQQPPSAGENHKCQAHKGQTKVRASSASVGEAHGCETIRSGTEDQHCPCGRAGQSLPKFHAHDRKRVHFSGRHDLHASDSAHYDCRHYPEMMGQVPHQQFQNGPMDFGTHFFSDHSQSGCLIM